MHTTHGAHIPGTRLGDNPPRKLALCGGVRSCLDCKLEAQAFAGGLHYHYEPLKVAPLIKVVQSLREAGATEDLALDAINSMHKNGILFRERD